LTDYYGEAHYREPGLTITEGEVDSCDTRMKLDVAMASTDTHKH